MNVHVYSNAYTYAQSVIFLSDNFRNSLREVIRENGLSPEKLMQDWGPLCGPWSQRRYGARQGLLASTDRQIRVQRVTARTASFFALWQTLPACPALAPACFSPLDSWWRVRRAQLSRLVS
jgi:hypothetical protein